MLDRRQRGLGARPLQAEVARLSPQHARWTAQTCVSVCRADGRFQTSQSGAVGLAVWGDVRVPSRHELVRQCLEEAGTRVSVEAIEARIEAHHGERPPRVTLAGIAHKLGATLHGGWMERKEPP